MGVGRAGMMAKVPEPLLLLHGFTQTGRGWDEVVRHLDGERYRPLAPDIRGHGAAGGAATDRLRRVRADVARLGGRAVRAGGLFAGRPPGAARRARAPERVTRLVLVSATARDRGRGRARARREADDDARRVDRGRRAADQRRRRALGRAAAVRGQRAQVAAAARADRLSNEPAGLAAALRGIGTGVMAPLWQRLGELAMPVVVLAGERDERYVALGGRLSRRCRTRRSRSSRRRPCAPARGPAAVAAALESGSGVEIGG